MDAGYCIIPRVSLDHSKGIADGNPISFPEFPQGGMITCKMVNGDLYAHIKPEAKLSFEGVTKIDSISLS